MNQIFDMEKIKKLFDEAEAYEDDGTLIKTIYLGDIRSITPSGKVYTPWAHSNLDACPKCKGNGHVRNPHGKIKDWTIARKKDRQLTINALDNFGHYGNWPSSTKKVVQKYRDQQDWWDPWPSCPECAGMGSLEARLDQDWNEQAERELNEINAWMHGSEGDGCDIMASRGVEDDSPET